MGRQLKEVYRILLPKSELPTLTNGLLAYSTKFHQNWLFRLTKNNKNISFVSHSRPSSHNLYLNMSFGVKKCPFHKEWLKSKTNGGICLESS